MAFTMVTFVTIMILISQGGTVAGATTRTSGSVPTTTTARATAPTSATATLRASGPTEASTTRTSGPTAATATTRTSGAIPTSTSASATGQTGAATTARTSGPVPATTTASPPGSTATATTARTSAPIAVNITASPAVQTATASTASTSGPTIAATTPVTSGSVPTTTTTRATVPTSAAPTANTSGQTATATTPTSGATATATTARTSAPIAVNITASPAAQTATTSTASTSGPTIAGTTPVTSGSVPTTTTTRATVPTSAAPTANTSGQSTAATTTTSATATTARTSAPTAANIAASQTVQTAAISTASTLGPTMAATTPVTSGSIPTTTTTRATVPTSAAPTGNTSGQTATATTTRTSGPMPTTTTASPSVMTSATTRASTSGPTIVGTTTRTSGAIPTTTTASPTVPTSATTTASTSVPFSAFTTTGTPDATPTSTTAATSVCSVNAPTIYAVPGQVGYLTSPNYPSSYYNNADCRWLIFASGYVVRLTILNFNLETGYDYLELYDGPQQLSSSLIIRTSSTPSQSVFYSSGQYMYIRFSSDSIIAYTGFRLTYEAINQQSVPTSVPTSDATPTSTTAATSMCSVNAPTIYAVPGQVGYLTSPNYPSPYYNNADCRWLIFASGYVVRVTVLNFNLETGYDYLELYDGAQQSSSSLIIRTSSTPSQSVFYSSGQYMYIRFSSDGSVTYSGFRLTYEAINQQSVPTSVPTSGTTTTSTTGPPLVCTSNETTLSAVPGQVRYLTSPYYPSLYYSFISCSWAINSASGYAIKATFLNATYSEFYFYFMIYDGPSESSPSIAWVSSTTSPTVYYSSGQSMYITFFSYGFSQNSFFNLTYEAVNQSSSPWSVCSSNGTTLSAVPGQVGYLTSLYFPTVYYGFISCSWTIISTNGYVVKATFLNVTSEFYTYIAIYDGMSASSPTLAWMYSVSSPTVYYSSGQSMYIWVATYGLSPNSSLSLTYEAVDQRSVPTSDTTTTYTTAVPSDTTDTTAAPSVCSVYAPTFYVVPGQVGYLTSPNYPYPYNNNDDCRWLITADIGYAVKVTVTDVSLETCCDYLELYDGTLESSTMLIARIRYISSQTVFISGQYMYIRFYSDGFITSSGFRLTYEAVDQQSVSTSVCPANGTALSALPGQVEYLRFPNHPSSDSNNTDCKWLINSNDGDVVKLTVVNASSDNFFYYIQIFDGMSESSPTLVTFYGIPRQTVYYSSGQYMYIRYTGYGSVTNSGLRVIYEAVNQPYVPTPSPTVPTTAPRSSDPCTCTCSCVSTCSRP